jgi:aspartate/methionine/tyrosine aminotransferase
MSQRSPSRRSAALRPTAVNAILGQVRALQAQGHAPISLMRGEPDFATPAHIVEAAAKSLRDGRTGYPNNQGEPALRETVAEKMERQTGHRYSPDDEILVTTGATLGIYVALAAVLDPGDEILVPSPIYDAYQSVIELVGAVARPVAAAIREQRFALDTEALAAACGPRTRALLLNTPWNPTGTVLRREELAAVAELAERRNLVVVSDEIYEAILYDDHRHISPAEISEEMRRRTIVVHSFSKSYAMTGWRLGYCAGPAALIRAAYLVLQQSSRGPAPFVQDAGVVALRGSQECVEAMRKEYAARRRQVCEALAGLCRTSVLTPEGGFFAMLDIRGLDQPSEAIQTRLLSEAGVVVVHGSAYGAAGEGTLRVSFATGGQNLRTGLSRLRDGLAALE